MSLNLRRSKTALLGTTVIVWLVVAAAAVTVALIVASYLNIPTTTPAGPVSAGAGPLSLCNSSRIVYAGAPIQLPQTHNCDPVHMQISVPNVIDTLQEPSSASHSHRVSHKAARRKLHHGTGNHPAESPITKAQRDIGRTITATTATARDGGFKAVALIGVVVIVIVALLGFLALYYLRRTLSKVGRTYRRRSGLIFISLILALWLGMCGYAWESTSAWAGSTTFDQAVGKIAVLVPKPGGPVDNMDRAADIGHSIFSNVGGTGAHGPCYRSTDAVSNDLSGRTPPDLDELLGLAPGTPVTFANWACAGATIPKGILGPQTVGGQPPTTQLAQMSRLERMPELGLVQVYIGANDLGLTGEVKLCVVTTACYNTLSAVTFQHRLNEFRADFLLMLQQLQHLKNHPFVVVMLSYDAMQPSAGGTNCPDAKGLDAQEIALLVKRNHLLNDAEKADVATLRDPHFITAYPQLMPLCPQSLPIRHRLVKPDIWGLWKKDGRTPNPLALHPTPQGANAIAYASIAAFAHLVDRLDGSIQKPSSIGTPTPSRNEVRSILSRRPAATG